jgi:hypothetical protein
LSPGLPYTLLRKTATGACGVFLHNHLRGDVRNVMKL